MTRAYAELERRGLIHGEVGRGTFVGAVADEDVLAMPVEAPGSSGDGPVDLGRNYPAPSASRADLARTLRALADEAGARSLLDYQTHAGRPAHRAAGAAWIARGGLEAVR